MKLIFIRHGHTEFNKQGRLQGQEVDLPLNETGIEQIEKAIQYLPKNIDLIISSPLKRAHHTAQLLNKKINKTIELKDDIKEFSAGSLAGKTWPEIEAETGDTTLHEKNTNITFDYRPYGGESVADFKKRILRFIEELKNTHHNKIILVVTHGGVIDTMHLLFPQKERRERDNATIHEFEI